MRILNWCLLVAIVLLVAGCGVLDITDDRIKEIADQTGSVVQGVVRAAVTPVADPYVPGAGAAAGAGGFVLTVAIIKGILKLMQKKSDEKLKAIADAVKSGG